MDNSGLFSSKEYSFFEELIVDIMEDEIHNAIDKAIRQAEVEEAIKKNFNFDSGKNNRIEPIHRRKRH